MGAYWFENLALFRKKRIKDITKQYAVKYLLRLLVEIGYISRKILQFYNNNIILHELLFRLIFTDLLKHTILNANVAKIIILLLILI